MVALYLRVVGVTALCFSAMKSTSAAVAFKKKKDMYNHLPTLSPLANFVREAAKRRIGTTPPRRKRPLLWKDASASASVCAPRVKNPPYCHLVVAVLCILTFGAMCQFDDALNLERSNVKFMQNGSLVVYFRERKSCEYRQGTSVAIASNAHGKTCPVMLLRRMLDRVPREKTIVNTTHVF
jgi:hypothetical protein